MLVLIDAHGVNVRHLPVFGFDHAPHGHGDHLRAGARRSPTCCWGGAGLRKARKAGSDPDGYITACG
jgi:hypothetical protein